MTHTRIPRLVVAALAACDRFFVCKKRNLRQIRRRAGELRRARIRRDYIIRDIRRKMARNATRDTVRVETKAVYSLDSRPTDVRSAPNSGEKADIAALPSWATSRHVRRHAASSSRSALACFRSGVSKPSVNQP